MMRAIAFLFLVCFSTATFGMTAHEWDFASPHKAECDAGNQLENSSCLSFAYNATDAKLNQLYKILVSALADPKPLIAAQRAWLKFRDAQCKFITGEYDGSGHSYSQNACLIDLTEKRILDLRSIWPCNGCVLFKDEYYQEDKWPPPGWDEMKQH
jgi:uncharacterized protein YecT (DUF1311 family)